MNSWLVRLLVIIAIMAFFPAASSPVLGQAVNQSSQMAASTDDLPRQAAAPSPPTEEKIGRVGAKLNDEINDMGNTLASFIDARITALLGDWLDRWSLYEMWLIVLVCALFTLVVLLLERTLRMLNRKARRRLFAQTGALSLAEMISTAFSRPLSLLVLSYGLYAAWIPLFHALASHGGSNLLQELARRITNVAASAALFWFAYRFIGSLDDYFGNKAKESAAHTEKILPAIVRSGRRPLRLIAFIIWLRIAAPLLGVPETILTLGDYAFAISLISTIAWLIIRAMDIFAELILSRYPIDVADNLEARKVHTQIRFLRRITVMVVMLVAFAAILMMFDHVRQLGTSLLASAGVLGIVAGLAAQRSITNLLVGVQIAITQPIRVDDVVVVENEWGKIEEITSTYVVVRIWDLRRLILPITYFTEKPFQNWTRTSADLIAAVHLYADYSLPVQAIRAELHRILQGSRLWDGKVWSLQVTDASDQTIELRALMSVADASSAWNLRCEVREKLITYVQEHFPASLPRLRAEVERPAADRPGYQESSRSRSANRSSSR